MTGGRWQAKTKLAIGDLSSWRLNQEVSDMIAEACRGIEAAESEAQGGVEAGARSVAAAVPRREAELEKAKLKVRLAKALADNEQKIVEELIAVQGKAVDIGGYYRPDVAKASKAMRPSATFNAALEQLRG